MILKMEQDVFTKLNMTQNEKLNEKKSVYIHVYVPGETWMFPKLFDSVLFQITLLTLHRANAFLAVVPHLSELGDKQVRPRCETRAHQDSRQHIIQMGRAACWKQAEQVVSFIAACQLSAHLVGPLASIHHPTFLPSWKH